MNITKDMIIKHCINCDSTLAGNHFQEWLPILEAGSKAKLTDTKAYLDLEYIRRGLNCGSCVRNGIEETVTLVVFKWHETG